MTSTKHTPGEWKVREGVNEAFIDAPSAVCLAIANSRSNSLADVRMMKANARLIAAAPELLEALKSCVERMAELQKHTNYPLAWPRVQAVNAIAKATGEHLTAEQQNNTKNERKNHDRRNIV